MPINDFLKSFGGGRGDDITPQVIDLLRRQIDTVEKNNHLMMDLRAEINHLVNVVADLNSRMAEVQGKLSAMETARYDVSESYVPEPVYNPVEDKPVAPPEPKAPPVRTLFAIMIDELRLSVVSDAERNSAQFVITAKGDSGTVSFNPDSSSFCLGNIEGEVEPYFEYTLNSRTPVSIHGDNSAGVTLAPDGCWVMDRPIHLTID